MTKAAAGYLVREIDQERRIAMDGDSVRNKDDAKGRLKEAAGTVTGDKGMKREGKADQAAGRAKDGVDKLTDKVKQVLNRD